MLNAFLVLCVAQAADCTDSGLEAVAIARLGSRPFANLKKQGGHVVEAHFHHPKTGLTDDDLDDVARLHWCRKASVGGSTTPYGLLKLFPMKRLKELWACGEQFTHESIRPFYINRPDVLVIDARLDKH